MSSESIVCEYYIHDSNQKHWAVGLHNNEVCVFFGPVGGSASFSQKRMNIAGTIAGKRDEKEAKGYQYQGAIQVDLDTLNFSYPDEGRVEEAMTTRQRSRAELTWLYSRDKTLGAKVLEAEFVKIATRDLGMSFKNGTVSVGSWSCSIGQGNDFDPYAELSAGHITTDDDVRVLMLFAALKHRYPAQFKLSDDYGEAWLVDPKSFLSDDRIAQFFKVDLETCRPFLEELGIISKPIDWTSIAEKSAVGSDFF